MYVCYGEVWGEGEWEMWIGERVFCLMGKGAARPTPLYSSAASDVYKRQVVGEKGARKRSGRHRDGKIASLV